uniref:Nucleocapsid protein n=1 Tax=Blattodean phenui-related virus OKIAV267 TaxID=2746242 RepID=A0A7D7F330_9VIRU|nr:nucleocapsid protein [Blattodean phenui-related virus OKIAV267]
MQSECSCETVCTCGATASGHSNRKGATGATPIQNVWIKLLKEAEQGIDLQSETNVQIILSLTKADAISSKERVNDILQAMAYAGFDPEYMFQIIYRQAKDATPEEGSFDIGGWKLKKSADFVQDLQFFAMVFMLRGASVYKILDKSDPEFQKALKHKCGQYGISVSKPPAGKRRSVPRSTVTLPRAAAIVPHWCLQLVHAGHVKTLVNPTVTRQLAPIPKVMAHSLYQSICHDKSLLPICYEIAKKFDYIINPNRKGRANRGEIMRFVDAAYNSKLFSETIRMSLAIKFDILTATTVDGQTTVSLTPEVVVARDLCVPRWESRRGRQARKAATKKRAEETQEEDGPESHEEATGSSDSENYASP